MKRLPIAYQLYSAREDAQKDLDATLSRLSALGYEGVEFAGFFDYDAKSIHKLLKKHKLKAVGSHVPVKAIEQDMEGVIAFHQEIGCKTIAVPYLEEQNRPGTLGFAPMLRLIYQFGRKCRKADIELLYHNHDFEFVELSGQPALDFLFAAIPESILKCEPDTCWIRYTGLDPAQYIRKYAGRCPLVHIKDFVGRRGENPPYALIGMEQSTTPVDQSQAFSFKPVGYGCQDVKAIVEAAKEIGAKWLVVEQDQHPERPALEDAKLSIDTLLA